MFWFSLAAHAQVHRIQAPFPTSRMFDVPDTVCLKLDVDLGMPDTEVEDGRFRATCRSGNGETTACMQLLTETWPSRFAPLRCQGDHGTLVLVPTPAFDPNEPIEDGVRILRTLQLAQATFRTDWPDSAGVLEGGSCGVQNGQLWIKAPPTPHRQSCLIVFPDTTERAVPIALVKKL